MPDKWRLDSLEMLKDEMLCGKRMLYLLSSVKYVYR